MGGRALWGSEVLRDCSCLPGYKRQAVICNKALHLMFKPLQSHKQKFLTFNEENRTEVHTNYSLYSSPGSFGTQKPVLQYVDSILLHPQSQTNQPKNHEALPINKRPNPIFKENAHILNPQAEAHMQNTNFACNRNFPMTH